MEFNQYPFKCKVQYVHGVHLTYEQYRWISEKCNTASEKRQEKRYAVYN